MAAHIGKLVELIEFGAGSCVKVQALLVHLGSDLRYCPIDISVEHLAHRYPGLDICPVVPDACASHQRSISIVARRPKDIVRCWQCRKWTNNAEARSFRSPEWQVAPATQ